MMTFPNLMSSSRSRVIRVHSRMSYLWCQHVDVFSSSTTDTSSSIISRCWWTQLMSFCISLLPLYYLVVCCLRCITETLRILAVDQVKSRCSTNRGHISRHNLKLRSGLDVIIWCRIPEEIIWCRMLQFDAGATGLFLMSSSDVILRCHQLRHNSKPHLSFAIIAVFHQILCQTISVR